MLISYKEASELTRRKTGVVIPVYFPVGIDNDCAAALLEDTVAMFCDQMDVSANICLSVDGEDFGGSFARALAEKYGVSVAANSKNSGKFSSAATGVKWLLENIDGLKYMAVVDQDGDHFANELVNLVRAALHIEDKTGDARVMILGRRISRHRPMGFLRGELEELADRVLLDALLYNAAINKRPLSMEFAYMHDEFPDFHSGYKLFTADIAEKVFAGEFKQAGVSDECYFRHACEAVMTVEALENGARLGVVNRTTINEQPVSTFGLYKRERMVADKIIWPCKRLDIPSEFVMQWVANHLHRLQLSTLAPQGRGELEKISELVAEAFSTKIDGGGIPQPIYL